MGKGWETANLFLQCNILLLLYDGERQTSDILITSIPYQIRSTIYESKNEVPQQWENDLTYRSPKKRLTMFLSPAGMPLTKLSLIEKN
jgi:hypothetical protein